MIVVLAILLGIDPTELLGASTSRSMDESSVVTSPQEERLEDFVSVVLAATENVWNQLFRTDSVLRASGRGEVEPTLTIFRDVVQSACQPSAAIGPFDRPADRHPYIDLGLYRVMRDRLGAGGDFVQA